jgi:hypothetical protein
VYRNDDGLVSTIEYGSTMYKVIKSLCAQHKTIDDSKMAITEHIRNVDRAILNTVFENKVRRVNECLENGGGNSEHHV